MQSKKLSVIKALTWQFLAFIITIACSIAITGSFATAGLLTLSATALCVVGNIMFELAWTRFAAKLIQLN